MDNSFKNHSTVNNPSINLSTLKNKKIIIKSTINRMIILFLFGFFRFTNLGSVIILNIKS